MSTGKDGDTPREQRQGRDPRTEPSSFFLGARPVELGGYRGLVAAACDDPALLAALTPPDSLWRRPGVELLSEGRNRVGRVRLPLASGG